MQVAVGTADSSKHDIDPLIAHDLSSFPTPTGIMTVGGLDVGFHGLGSE